MASTRFKNPAEPFLRRTRASRAEDLARAYADYLLHEADAYQLPVDIDRIFQHFQLPMPVKAALASQRGLTTSDLRVLLNASDPRTVQKFTAAHELLEMLFFAVKEGGADEWMDDRLFLDLTERKERLCDIGAAEVVMPLALFRREVPRPAAMPWIQELASRCELSLTATIWRVLETDLVPAVLVVSHCAHKPREFVPSVAGQFNLFGPPEAIDPPKKLRILRVFTAPSCSLYVPQHKSITADSSIQHCFDEGIAVSAVDTLDIPGLSGTCWVESLPVTVGGERQVISLVHLDERSDVNTQE